MSHLYECAVTPHCNTRKSRLHVAGRAADHSGNCTGTGPGAGGLTGLRAGGARRAPIARPGLNCFTE